MAISCKLNTKNVGGEPLKRQKYEEHTFTDSGEGLWNDYFYEDEKVQRLLKLETFNVRHIVFCSQIGRKYLISSKLQLAHRSSPVLLPASKSGSEKCMVFWRRGVEYRYQGA